MTNISYETDFYAWAQQQAKAIRAKDMATLDIERLAEEVEDLGRAVRKGIGSQLERLSLAYRRARLDAADETVMDPETFPEVCPWTIEQILNDDFLPQAVPHRRLNGSPSSYAAFWPGHQLAARPDPLCLLQLQPHLPHVLSRRFDADLTLLS